LAFFLDKKYIEALSRTIDQKEFEKIKFHDAFKLLHKITGEEKYNEPTITKFGAYEEILLTRELGNPFFVTHYISNEVAFYHADDRARPELAVNADLMFPGFGELIGSGERVKNEKEVLAKANRFELDLDDYQSYIASRCGDVKVHSGWGMGVERFLQCLLKLPFIWEAKVFPRVDNSTRP
jgi:asparaginyl-tRNA synthetase